MAQHPHSIIVEDEAGGIMPDLKKLTNDLADERAPDGSGKAQEKAPEGDPDWLPAKWKGKSEKERADMYRNLESVYGRVANDLGQQRKITDEILLNKRAADLGIKRDEAPVVPKRQVSITAAELLAKPGEIFERELAAATAEIEARVEAKFASKDAKTKEDSFAERHADAATIVSSPEFVEFVNASRTRSHAAERVRLHGDIDTADALLTEFKESRKAAPKQNEDEAGDEPAQNRDAERARQASFESSSARAQGTPKKIYRRADLIKLKMNDPDTYAELNDEILRAYAENRVK
jgi:hypothetical protein